MRNIEAEHKKLFTAHAHIRAAADLIHDTIRAAADLIHDTIRAAADLIHDTIVDLVAASRHAKERQKLHGIINGLEYSRDNLDKAMEEAGTARTDLIQATGCDGTCTAAGKKQEASSA